MDKDKLKRFAAILGIVMLLAVFCTPMIFALGGKEFNMGYFFAALAAAFFVPVLTFIMMEVHRIFVKKEDKKGVSAGKAGIQNVIFDVGNVLMKFDWQGLLDSFGYPEDVKERMAQAMMGSGIWNERDRGLFEEQYYVEQMVKEAPELEDEIREFMRRSPETITLNDYAVTWVKYLKSRGYHCFVLSNYPKYMLEENIKQMEFLKYMDGAVFSCEVKELKPEEKIYKKLLSSYHLQPEQCVFIDDKQENLTGAAALGIRTVLFTDFKQAAKELEKLGIK